VQNTWSFRRVVGYDGRAVRPPRGHWALQNRALWALLLPLRLGGLGCYYRSAMFSLVFGTGAARDWTSGHSPDGAVEDSLEIHLRQGRAFHVFVGADLFGALQPLFIGDRARAAGALRRIGVPLVKLRADEDDRDAGRMVRNFRVPLCMVVRRRTWKSPLVGGSGYSNEPLP
jgi:hypothetical protein